MFRTELFRSGQFRLAAAFVAGTALVSILLFAFVYWQTTSIITERVRILLEQSAAVAVARPEDEVVRQITFEIAGDPVHVIYDGLFTGGGRRIAGNLSQIPDNLPPDGHPHRLHGVDYEPDLPASVYAIGVARIMGDGSILVLTRDVKAVEALRTATLRALGLGLVPAFGLLLAIGLLLGRRALARVKTVHRTIEQIMAGDLQERLPTTNSGDDVDGISRSVNRMLDELERLLHEVKGVGDSIAHELRTPLARARARLERGRKSAESLLVLRQAVDDALGDLDQAVALVRALLRVGEIEGVRRRSGFGLVDLSQLVQDVYDLFQPVAEEQGRSLTLRTVDLPPVRGDEELLMEAVANLVDNALKYTPPGGAVWLETARDNGRQTIRVADNGPGIAPEERASVFTRFYRGRSATQAPGHGLGLSIVAAIVRLHDFRLEVRDAPQGGALFVLIAADHAPAALPDLSPPRQEQVGIS